MNSYIKVSQIPAKSLDTITSDSNKLINLRTVGSTINTDLKDSLKYTLNYSKLSPDAIFIGLNQDNLHFNCNIDFTVDTFNGFKWLYYEPNFYAPEKIEFVTQNIFDFSVTFLAQRYNNFLIYPIFKNNTNNILNKNLIKSFIIDNQNILTLDLNLPSCETCSLTNLDNLQEFTLGKFNNLSTFILSNTEKITKINLGILAPVISSVDLSTNKLEYISISGSNTILTTDNCLLPIATLKYIKFTNCNPDIGLLRLLQENNIEFEIKKTESI